MSVTIPESVTSFGDQAFYGCNNVFISSFTVNYTGTLEQWLCIDFLDSDSNPCGDYLYINGELLTELVIPETITEIKKSAFEDCESITSITIHDQVKSIGESAFSGCKNLAKVNIPDSVLSIGGFAFSFCTSLLEVDIPDSVTSIGAYAFADCQSLSRVAFGENITLTAIEKYTFFGCTSLTDIVIPDGIMSIGDHAFSQCSKLARVSIPESVTIIDISAFSSCKSLTSITIPANVTEIESLAFFDCNALVEVYNYSSLDITKGSSDYGRVAYCTFDVYNTNEPSKLSTDENGFIIHTTGDVKTLVRYIGTDDTITIPAGVSVIGNYALYNCDSLKEITISDDVTSIGNYAFESCGFITKVTIPASVKTVGKYAFNYCSNLTDVYYTGTEYQYNKIKFGSNNGEFYEAKIHYLGIACEHLEWNDDGSCVECRHQPYKFALNEDGESYTLMGFGNGKAQEDLQVPAMFKGKPVTAIGENSFAECTSLRSVTIHDDIKTIGESAFFKCEQLESVIFGENSKLESIETKAFFGCKRLTEIALPDGLKSLDGFEHCEGLTSVKIPDSVTIINGFEFCINLTTITFGENSQLTTIGSYAFYTCEKLANFAIPKTVTSIGKEVFVNCKSMKSVVIYDNVTFIDERAFKLCNIDVYCEATSQPSGWHVDWNVASRVYWAGEWEYDIDGNPVPKE